MIGVVGENGGAQRGTASVVDGKLEYTLSDAITHSNGEGTNTAQGADIVKVTVQDGNGNTFEVDVKVNVVDDVPTLSVGGFSGTYGQGITGKVEFSFGADSGGDAKIELSVNNGGKVAGVSTDGGKTWDVQCERQEVDAGMRKRVNSITRFLFPAAKIPIPSELTVTDAGRRRGEQC